MQENLTDHQLLRQYVDKESQAAFSQLFERHVRRVYATCLREGVAPDVAEDATQVVFITLSKKAASFCTGVVLSGWLFNAARFAAQSARRKEHRRRLYEQKTVQIMANTAQPGQTSGEDIGTHLNEALAGLGQGDRDAVLLRYLDGLTFKETGERLRISEDAARMRVLRSLCKLRTEMRKHEDMLSEPVSPLPAVLPAPRSPHTPPESLRQAGRSLSKRLVIPETSTFPSQA